ncbi:insulinase family protein [Clostridium sp. Cult3]|uniref:insulinase family protein n=1 Tax=Clostridium sp. Cult3 TaxID=2079004 RepID=UPI001F29BB96|nr:insulinase family protein [Clostridium sp. Cult3]MCF6460308.1 peptidase M16 [Clostridium sp. Cult3]
MGFEVGKNYYGFKLVDEYEVKEIQSIARVFSHEKSGARLLHLENDDDNKVFSIGFRTPPWDSTGVPHIIEHCVLSGSRKYKTKEPFMDMVKGSLQTFINAMTFSDKTLYPVASRNDKDFFNLMDVYLDAVFYPQIYEEPKIFMQEGWHYELFDRKDPVIYKGVVYNEMQGAYSSPERILGDEINKSLYPDTCYRYSSGGDPEVIPDLTYEGFLNFHKRFYHPSNSYIYLYGNGDVKKHLEHIDRDYLSHFDRKDIDSHIAIQKPFKERKEVIAYYPILKDEDEDDRTYLSLNFVLGENIDPETYLLANILALMLIESEAAPVKKALLQAGIGEDVFSINVGGLQPGFGIVAKHTSSDKKDRFEKIIFDTLNNLVEKGIDEKLIEASINIMEYSLREAGNFATKGLVYNMQSMDSWLYDGSPTTHLQYEDTINKFKENIGTGYFEQIIRERLIDNSHSSLVVVEPKKGLGEEKDKDIEKRLAEFKESLDEEEMEVLIRENEELKEMQLSDDSPEAKATIPKLSISDVDKKAEVIPQEIIKLEDITLLFHNIFTSKIAYIDFYFDTSMVDEKLIPYINLLSGIVGKVDTQVRDYSELANEIYINTGGIVFDASAYVEKDNDEIYYPKFVVKGKAIENNIPKMMELINELLTQSKIEDKNRIKELIQQIKSRIEMTLFNVGHSISSLRVGSYFSPSRKYTEKLKGLDFYWFICDILEDFDNNSQEIISNLNKVYSEVFNINNLIISFTGDGEDLALIKNNLPVVVDNLNREKLVPKKYDFTKQKTNEGILSSANVQYVSKGYNFKKLDYKYNGNMRVLATILNGDYLHNRIRAQGGAYGAGVSIDRTGHLTTFSYRDPNLLETINVYDGMADYVKNLDLDESELTTYIIGTMSRLDPAMTPYDKGQLATIRYISNITQEEIQKTREEVLNTKLEDIKAYATLLNDAMKEDYLCVLGNENKIRENENIFNKLVKLKK